MLIDDELGGAIEWIDWNGVKFRSLWIICELQKALDGNGKLKKSLHDFTFVEVEEGLGGKI